MIAGRTRAEMLADPGLLSSGLRFALAGVLVTFVYLTSTTVLAVFVGLPFQAALAIGFCLGLVVHFTLQRGFVWAHEQFALPLRHQMWRYLLAAGAQYGITAACTSLLPAALGLPTEVVYLACVPLVVSANFLVFRHRIFHAKAPLSASE
jgi:putative flippase GtrA